MKASPSAVCALAFSFALAWAAGSQAEAPVTQRTDHAQTSGLGIAGGLSTETVFLGGEVLYYFQLAEPRWRLAVHAGAGVMPFHQGVGTYWGLNGGTFLAFGRHHRLIVGLQAGTLEWEQLALHSQTVAIRQRLGAGLEVGWEWMSRWGPFVRISIGPGFSVERETALSPRQVSGAAVGGLLLGYKLW